MNFLLSSASVTWRVIIIFSLALFGIIARKYGLIKEEARTSFADVMLNITLPPLIFVSMIAETNWGRLATGIFLPLVSLLLVALVSAVAIIPGRLKAMPSSRFKTFLILCSMPNSGFIGFPVVLSVLGQSGLTYAVLYDTGTTIAFCSIAMAIMKGGRISADSWKSLINPTLIAVVCGLLVGKFGITVPDLIIAPLKIMGDATIPLAMLLMGYMLGGLKFRFQAITWELGIVCLNKLILYPLMAYGIMLLLPFQINHLIQTVVVIEAAMPSMASTIVLVQKYGGDDELAATGIFLTTSLSIITIPLILQFLSF